jgi:rare lipoprotein A
LNTAAAQTFRWDDPKASPQPAIDQPVDNEAGAAHRYPDYHEGNITMLGETFRHAEMTAAHPKLPLGTIVQVTRTDNNQHVRVRINDRGAYCDGCVIDLSRAAADALGLPTSGSTQVRLTLMGTSSQNPQPPQQQLTAVAQANTPLPATQLTARGVAQQPTHVADTPLPDAQLTARGIAQPQPQPALPTTPTEYATNDADFDDADMEDDTEFDDIHVEIIIPACQPSAQLPAQPMLQARTPVVGAATETNITVVEAPMSPYTVQFGAYAKLTNAKRHVQTLQSKGFNNIFLLQETQDDGSLLHRVIAAPFAKSSEAEVYVQELAQYHQIKGLVFRSTLEEVK